MNKELIPVEVFCSSHQAEISFVSELGNSGLIEIISVKNVSYLHERQMRDLERMIRLHYEMDINIEGIEAIVHLLERMDNLHQELRTVKNRLSIYESYSAEE